MTTPNNSIVNELSDKEKLPVLRDLIENMQLQEFYSIMINEGFKYPAIGLSFSTGKLSLSYIAAGFMRGVAKEYGISVDAAKLDLVRQNMAFGYLGVLEKIIKEQESTNKDSAEFNRDITWQEALTFHNEAFTNSGLPKESWTLYAPLTWPTSDDSKSEIWSASLDFAMKNRSTTTDPNGKYINYILQVFCLSEDDIIKSGGLSLELQRKEWLYHATTDGVNNYIGLSFNYIVHEEAYRLDGLINSWNNNLESRTTGSTLLEHSQSFFTKLGADNLSKISIKPLDYFGTTEEIYALATTDSTNSIEIRNALKFLSPWVFTSGLDTKGRELELYREDSNTGFITKEWILDRITAQKLYAEYRLNGSDNNNPIAMPYYEADTNKVKFLATGEQVLIDSLRQELQGDLVFGSGNDDTHTGTKRTDHIYGENGNDTLTGEAGDDYIEGGTGEDSLSGGDGSDLLLGMMDNDVLDGGEGNDTLKGGAGNDTYIIDGSAGRDVIIDTGENIIKYRDNVLHGGKAVGGAWEDEFVTYTTEVEGNATNLIITVGSSITVIKGWEKDSNKFGITLEDPVEEQPVDVNGITVNGDLKPADQSTSQEGIQTGRLQALSATQLLN